MAKKRVTIQMVADRAGVSRGTVDRVLNQRPHVKPEQQEKVVAAMKELGYEPVHKRQASALGLKESAVKVCRLGIILPGGNEYDQREILRGIHDAQIQLADYAVEIITERAESALPDEVLRHVASLERKGAAGIALQAVNHVSVADKIDALYAKGIPVVTFGTDISDCKRLCFYGQDIRKNGYVAGGLMSHYIKKTEEVLVAMGNPEIPEHRVREEQFRAALIRHGFPEEKIATIETYDDYTLTYEKVKRALREKPDIGGIYVVNHSLTGCVDALRMENRLDEVLTVSSGITGNSLKYLKSGETDFCITPNVYLYGYQPLFILEEYLLKKKKPENTVMYSGTEIVCRENLL